jgi:hypothetical protein
MTIRKAAFLAFDVKNFSPLMTHSCPSCTARVRKSVGSAPAWGSVIENAENTSPSSSGCRNRAFCAGVP